MRNLVTAHRGVLTVRSETVPDLPLAWSEFDPFADTMICTYGPSADFRNVSVFASWELPQEENENEEVIKVLSSKYFSDTDNVVLVLSNGDLINVTGVASYSSAADGESVTPGIDSGEEAIVEIVGSIDDGVTDAAWSPDEEILSIVTSKSVILLSRVFESIAEASIQKDDLKISKHVSVGWGKKETQFEGKGAKALRDPTMPAKVDSGVAVESDSGQFTRISWRGDGEFVAVSTIDEVEGGLRRRTVRVYGRDGSLNSVSEPVDWLEGEISWRPSGNLIAGVQNKPSGQDLVFFERNGLRRGEFSLRRENLTAVGGASSGEHTSTAPPTEISHAPAVKGLAWNIDSDVLAVVFENTVQLWTVSNYAWHLKQEILPRGGHEGHIKWIRWHPEKPLSLLVCYEIESGCVFRLETHTLLWSLISGPSQQPNDLGTTVILDGSDIKITPLKIANTPPPMAFRTCTIDKNETVLHAAVNNTNDTLAILTRSRILIAEWNLSAEGRKVKTPQIVKEIPLLAVLPDDTVPKQLAFINNLVAIVVDEVVGSTMVVLELVNEIDENDETQLEYSVAAVHNIVPDVFILKTQSDYGAFVFETVDAKVHRLSPYDLEVIEADIARFPERCIAFEVDSGVSEAIEVEQKAVDYENDDIEASGPVAVFATPTAYGLSGKGRLYANQKQLSGSVTSLTISESHVIFTTAQHYLKFCHLSADVDEITVPSDEDQQSDERCRSIERGSLIVSVIPSKTALILQAPRGNLETIHPRIMVLSEVRRNIDAIRYDLAFKSCRVHRIDLNLLHDYSPQTFYDNLDTFVDQLASVEYIDLFLSGLKEADVSQTMYKETITEGIAKLKLDDQEAETAAPVVSGGPNATGSSATGESNKVNRICDALISVLDTPDRRTTYLQSILTAHACKSPPDLEAALLLAKELFPSKKPNSGSEVKSSTTNLAETAVQHLCFLQDVELLYRTALGLYDLELTLLVAQQSQKDPKEYLPFLQNIQLQTPLRGKFLIDTHLKRYEKALLHLSQLGEEAFDELLDYVVEHQLYKPALSIYKYDAGKQDQILELYASFLQGQTNYSEAALAYEALGKFEDAVDVYQLSGDWSAALAILSEHKSLFNEDKLIETAQHLGELAYDAHQYQAAATIQLDYLKDIKEAARILCKGHLYDEAIRVVTLHNHPEYLELIIDSGLLEGFGQISELVSDCKSQVKSQVNRIRELRTKKAADPLGFFGGGPEDDTPDNVSIAPTESSTAPSFFTRYTGKTAGTAQTGASRRTAKNKRREERKRARGKKGSVYEEEYLVNSMGRLIDRLHETQPEATRLIEGLIRRKMRSHAYQVQAMFVQVLQDVSDVVEEIFTLSEKDRERYDDDGNVYYLDPLPLPVIKPFPTKHMLDF
ncbi:Elongator subunit IKI3 [Sugiyamaella lignohabitans]|uniref:Elongator complex protein 1 n=1 Tax=Sugiyamaella lignohabitans TaxID=796027 RepID=A0A167D378_9ASCO|nr:Elongator subunit IKI3 [Sugiyamaella lignohabitans]ANB12424.1 Elongator subunit IKI3 [Sugiyamaella lignohabitans]